MSTQNYKQLLESITPLELAALRSAYKSSDGNGHDFGYTEDIKIEGQTKQQVGGVISSLIQKGIIARDDEYGQFAFDTFSEPYEAAEAVKERINRPDPAPTESPLCESREREARIAQGLRDLAKQHGITLREPLVIDSNGEFSIQVSNGTDKDGHKDPCGEFGTFADQLSRHSPRCGFVPTKYLSPKNGWCRINHFDAEKLVAERLPHPENPCHVQNLESIELLERQGFEGPDASLEESLFHYGIAWRAVNDEILFIYKTRGKCFDRCTIKRSVDARKEWDWVNYESFLSTQGQAAEEWDAYPLEQKVSDLVQYHGYEEIFGSSYWEGFGISNE